MVIVHTITLRPTDVQRDKLQLLGVKLPLGLELPGGGTPYVTFDIDEGHENWGQLRRLFLEWNAGDFVKTLFSPEEVANATHLELVPEWHHGYPQPDQGFGFLDVTYDLTGYCIECGVGLKQKAPFRMKREPKWGRRGILQLNWVFDEFFVTPDVWSAIFEPQGIPCRPVMNTRGGELNTVVQIVVEEEVGILTAGLTPQRCVTCERVKYLPATRGFFPALVSQPARPIAKTRESFGSGASAHKCVLVSQALARAVAESGVRGTSINPVA
jgi:hypothetical protein